MPAFDNLETMVAELSHLFTGNAPHLVASADQTEEMEKEPAAETAVAPSPIPVSSPTAHITVQTHYEAKKVLVALESYFAKNEPSSPALILVHQAQLLIGRPLVEALTALASGRAPILNIDQRFGFFLDMDAMKQLTIEIPAEEERYGGGTAQDFLIQNRENAVASMLGVEAFLARKEPSSPVLMLLERARSFLDTNFLHILKELLPEEKKQ